MIFIATFPYMDRHFVLLEQLIKQRAITGGTVNCSSFGSAQRAAGRQPILFIIYSCKMWGILTYVLTIVQPRINNLFSRSQILSNLDDTDAVLC